MSQNKIYNHRHPTSNKQNHYSLSRQKSHPPKTFTQTSCKTINSTQQCPQVKSLQSCKSMSCSAFKKWCENSESQSTSSFEKLLQKQKIKIQMQKWQKQKLQFNQQILNINKNQFPKANNLKQLKRKSQIFRYKDIMQKVKKICQQ